MDLKNEEWKIIFDSIQDERFTVDTKDYQQIILDFLIPDSINPKLFQANVNFLDIGMRDLYNGKFEPTESIDEYGFITHRPSGYPLWFLAAYPDVASWYSEQYKKDEQILFKVTEKSEEYYRDEKNFINNRFSNQILKKLICYFKAHSGERLETSSEARPVETISGSKLADSILPIEIKFDMLINEAKSLKANSRFFDSINKFTQALELVPKAITFYNRGEVYYELKDYNNAFNDFDKAIKADPNFKEAYVARGSLKISLFKDKNGAISDLKRAADLGHPKAKEMYEQFFE